MVHYHWIIYNRNAVIWKSLDLRKYKLSYKIDTALYALFEAGIFGPELEKILNAKGYTLGHSSFNLEYSTLGGWIVTRGAGQESTYYGKIEGF